jgi:hypothetical protein
MTTKRIRRVLGAAAFSILALGGAVTVGSALAADRSARSTGTALSSGAPPPSPSQRQEDAAAHSSPQVQHVPTRLATRTPSDVLANLPNNPDWQLLMRDLTTGPERDSRVGGMNVHVGAPMFVRGLGTYDNDEWVLPLQVGSETIAIAWVSIDRGGVGTGYVGGMAQWTGSFPKIGEADARRAGSVTGDPVTTAELAWTYIRGAGDRSRPFWRLVRVSGDVFFLFDAGQLTPAKQYVIP